MKPSVKGLLVGGAVVNANRLVERGTLERAQVEARLSGEALEMLEAKIDSSQWYAVGPYREILDLVWETEAASDPEYMREKGRRWAEKLYEADRYQQLQYSDDQRGEIQSSEDAVRQGNLIASLVKTFWSFVEPAVDLDPDHPNTLRMVFDGAAELPEANRYTTEGFMNHITERGGSKARTESERPTPDRVVFRLPLALRDDAS